MKKLIIIALAFTCVVAHAQVDRSKAPKPAPAREIKIGDYQSFALKNGLQVFVVENHKLPRVQFSLQLKNDPILEKRKGRLRRTYRPTDRHRYNVAQQSPARRGS